MKKCFSINFLCVYLLVNSVNFFTAKIDPKKKEYPVVVFPYSSETYMNPVEIAEKFKIPGTTIDLNGIVDKNTGFIIDKCAMSIISHLLDCAGVIIYNSKHGLLGGNCNVFQSKIASDENQDAIILNSLKFFLAGSKEQIGITVGDGTAVLLDRQMASDLIKKIEESENNKE